MKLLRRDLYIEPINAFIDPPVPVEKAIITHGHSDHAKLGHKNILATPETIGIMKSRYGEGAAQFYQELRYEQPLSMGPVTITLYPAGHILGSAQVLLEYQGQRIVVSGDYKRLPDKTCTSFIPVTCDIFVTEATFGLPVFQHPDPAQEIKKVLNSLKIFPERGHLIGVYALGKAQRVISLLHQAGYDLPIFLHGSLISLCDFYQRNSIPLGERRPATGVPKEQLKGAIVLAPPSALKEVWSRRLADPILSMASGWMTIKQRVRQRGIELPLIISDHADWNELTTTITDTKAGEVWVTHGQEDALVHWCQTQGIKASPLHLQGRDEEEGEA